MDYFHLYLRKKNSGWMFGINNMNLIWGKIIQYCCKLAYISFQRKIRDKLYSNKSHRTVKPDYNLGVGTKDNFMSCILISCKYIILALKYRNCLCRIYFRYSIYVKWITLFSHWRMKIYSQKDLYFSLTSLDVSASSSKQKI